VGDGGGGGGGDVLAELSITFPLSFYYELITIMYIPTMARFKTFIVQS
jgi:hypothetical protein